MELYIVSIILLMIKNILALQPGQLMNALMNTAKQIQLLEKPS